MICVDGHRAGYINEAGELVIALDFAMAGSFHNGLAPVRVQYGKYGYIDTTGKFAIAPQFDEASDFSCGVALVRKGNKTGYIDTTGQFLSMQYNSDAYTPVSSFSEGVAWVENAAGKRAVIDTAGNLLTSCDYVWSMPFSDGVAWASVDMGDDFYQIEMGLIGPDGSWLIEPGIYTDAQSFSNGVCWARKMGEEGICLIDKQGNVLDEIDNGEMPSTFSGGVSVNVGGDILAIRNTTGVTIYSTARYLPVRYGGFSEGVMLVRGTSDDSYYLMRDTAYTPAQPEQIIEGSYELEQLQDTSFEIAIKLYEPYAIVNGVKTEIDPDNPEVVAMVENSRSLLPMRFIVEHMPGWSVSWDYLTDSALIQSDSVSALFQQNSSIVELVCYNEHTRSYDYGSRTLDQPPVNRQDRLFLPVRALGEIVGANVFWDARGLAVVSNQRTSLSEQEASELLMQFVKE